MTEAQDVQAAAEPEAPPSPPVELSRRFDVDGTSWTIVALADGLSWDLYGRGASGAGRGPRIGHITVSERGYSSVDSAGVERGPYPTLDEAAYPLGAGEPALLGDAVGRPGAPARLPDEGRSGRPTRRAASARRVAVVLLALVVLVATRTAVRGRPGA